MGMDSSVMLFLFFLALLVAVLWVLMPFAIFGTKPILRQILEQQQRTNQLLQQQIDNEKSRDAAGRPKI
mgnify:CR=1 FL=1